MNRADKTSLIMSFKKLVGSRYEKRTHLGAKKLTTLIEKGSNSVW